MAAESLGLVSNSAETHIDVTAVFAARCPNDECPDLLLPDGHPNAAGYALVADTVQGALGPLLEQR